MAKRVPKQPAKNKVVKQSAEKRVAKQLTSSKIADQIATGEVAKQLAQSKTTEPPTDSSSKYAYNTRFKGEFTPTAKRKLPAESWESLEERGKKRRKNVEKTWRRKDTVAYLVESIYADIEAAIDIQRRRAGTGDALSDDERASFEASEDLRLDYLREFRLAAMFARPKDEEALKMARLPRGQRFDSIRAARDMMNDMERQYRQQLNAIVSSLGWTTVAICLHSENFRSRFLERSNAVDFAARQDLLTSHRRNIEFFAKTRLFNCLEKTAEQQAQDVLFRDLHCLSTGTAIPISRELTEDEAEHSRLKIPAQITGLPADGIGIDHPYEWKLSADGNSATRLQLTYQLPGAEQKNALQKNVSESIVLIHATGWGDRKGWVLRDDPRYRTSHDPPCEGCDEEGDDSDPEWKSECQCNMNKLKIRLGANGTYSGDRIELCHINPIMGTGVRALQRFPARSLLAEYLGEIYPPSRGTKYNVATYLMEQKRSGKRGDVKAGLTIDPAIFGNWTRYINHSCNANTAFDYLYCGDKVYICVVVGAQPIAFGDIVTTNYGRNYFVGQKIACRCGTDKCTLFNADKGDDPKLTLKQARKNGVAPDWAK